MTLKELKEGTITPNFPCWQLTFRVSFDFLRLAIFRGTGFFSAEFSSEEFPKNQLKYMSKSDVPRENNNTNIQQ